MSEILVCLVNNKVKWRHAFLIINKNKLYIIIIIYIIIIYNILLIIIIINQIILKKIIKNKID